MARYQIHHKTIYSYAYPVAVSHHSAHLKPMDSSVQSCLQYHLKISPEPSDLNDRKDYFDNTVSFFSVQEGHNELVVDANSEVSVQHTQLPLPNIIPDCQQVVNDVTNRINDEWQPETINALQFIHASPKISISDKVKEFAKPLIAPDQNYLEVAQKLADHIHQEFSFDSTATDVTTPVDEVLEKKAGVCQDFAHLMIAALRSVKLPVRYVSGYILTDPPPGQERLLGADASHAWVSIYVPAFGWIDVDPTNNQLCDDRYVTVAVGRDYSDVSMLKGAVTGGGDHSIGIQVTVTPLDSLERAKS
ncbi:MAG: transglutaminase family protein [Verrucomicrobiota bacterium]